MQRDRPAKLVLAVTLAGAGVGLSFVPTDGASFGALLLPQLIVGVTGLGIAAVLLTVLQEITDFIEEHAKKIDPTPAAGPAMREAMNSA